MRSTVGHHRTALPPPPLSLLADANLAAGVPSAGGGDSDEFVSVEVLESMIGSVVSLVVVHVTDLQIRLEHFSATTGAVARNLPCFVCVCVCLVFFRVCG